MNIIPNPQEIQLFKESVNLSKIKWIFGDNSDERVINEALAAVANSVDGFPIYINASVGSDEAYTLEIIPEKAVISSNGANGAFYALQTLKQLLSENGNIVKCQKIVDAPDMKYRGFYHDVTRGKVPTLKTLKELVDKMAGYKLNSLQLYAEHAFEFKEYEFCREKLGFLTKDEIRELDAYCRSKFIELVPSVSCFGHLYHLLQDGNYKHLCELSDYTPKTHYWQERMVHHTINPLSDESFELIKSLIDQYLEVSSSDKFNICCDETFDLGNGVNEGKNKAELYVNFVKKIIGYLTEKGKKVMMWGDIALQHPNCLSELPSDVIFLNWNYDKTPPEAPVRKIHESGKTQILCPGTSTWNAFSEDIPAEEGNITKMAEYAYKYNAEGLLNTNWGDLGNVASLTTASYGIALGAAVCWNRTTRADSEFRNAVSEHAFGCGGVFDIIAELSDFRPLSDWRKSVLLEKSPEHSAADYENAFLKLQNIRNLLSSFSFRCETEKREVLLAVDGYIVAAAMCAAVNGFNLPAPTDFEKFLDELRTLWLFRNKPSELDEVIRVIKSRLRI